MTLQLTRQERRQMKRLGGIPSGLQGGGPEV
jgi:hypothetical protein